MNFSNSEWHFIPNTSHPEVKYTNLGQTYSPKSALSLALSAPLAITFIKSSVRTNGTLSLFMPNFFFLWSRKCPKSMWNI